MSWIDRLVESEEHRPVSNAAVALCDVAILAYEWMGLTSAASS